MSEGTLSRCAALLFCHRGMSTILCLDTCTCLCVACENMLLFVYCIAATDLGNPCSADEPCTLGNGGTGSICSTNCVCDEANGYVKVAETCEKSTRFDILTSTCILPMEYKFPYVKI